MIAGDTVYVDTNLDSFKVTTGGGYLKFCILSIYCTVSYNPEIAFRDFLSFFFFYKIAEIFTSLFHTVPHIESTTHIQIEKNSNLKGLSHEK